jgi:hypothetical protein
LKLNAIVALAAARSLASGPCCIRIRPLGHTRKNRTGSAKRTAGTYRATRVMLLTDNPRVIVALCGIDPAGWGAPMNKVIVVTAALSALVVAGCATRASEVAPTSISALEYSYLGCQEARAELNSARQREFALTRKQNNAATADAAAVFLFALPLGSVFGADKEGELAQAKGEVLALDRRVKMACTEEARAAAAPDAPPAAVPVADRGTAPAKSCGAVRQPDGTVRLVPC